MCDFISYKINTRTGEIIFLTDKDLTEHGIEVWDGIGHHAILRLYPYTCAPDWIDMECTPANTHPAPPEILKAWRNGKMRKMAQRVGYKKLVFNDGGYLHCDDGPAVEYTGGGKEWYRDGRRCGVEFHDGTTGGIK